MSATPTSGKVTLMATMWARRGLTGEVLRPHLSRVTVAPITSTIRGLSTDVPVGPANGLDHNSVVSCDNIVTVPVRVLGRQLGVLLPEQEAQVTEAVRAAFDLDCVVQHHPTRTSAPTAFRAVRSSRRAGLAIVPMLRRVRSHDSSRYSWRENAEARATCSGVRATPV